MYEKLYLSLFNAITDALAHMENRNYGLAEACLKDAQRGAEDMYVSGDEPEAE